MKDQKLRCLDSLREEKSKHITQKEDVAYHRDIERSSSVWVIKNVEEKRSVEVNYWLFYLCHSPPLEKIFINT